MSRIGIKLYLLLFIYLNVHCADHFDCLLSFVHCYYLLICIIIIIIIFTEIARVRASLFQINGVKKEPLTLPEPEGAMVTLNEKVYVPVREHPDVSWNERWSNLWIEAHLKRFR